MSVGPEGGDTLGTFATLISQSSIGSFVVSGSDPITDPFTFGTLILRQTTSLGSIFVIVCIRMSIDRARAFPACKYLLGPAASFNLWHGSVLSLSDDYL